MQINSSQIEMIQTYCKMNSTCPLKKLLKQIPKARLCELGTDMFIPTKDIRKTLIEIRDTYLEENPEAFLTLDHIKSNYDNSWATRVLSEQTEELNAVSESDFSNLSEILENIRTPQDMKVFRAMEGNDFQIGRISPEEFFAKYYQEGKIVTVPIYMSTSLDKNIAYRFAENNPYRFILKLNVPKDTPAAYMEELTPGDTYGAEDELLVTKNAMLQLGKFTKEINPLNKQPIYELEGTVVGHRFIKPEPIRQQPPEEDPEMMELINAIRKERS